MTATFIEQDTDWLEALDFEPNLACEAPQCSDTPTWRMELLCCGRQFLLCAPCKRAEQETINEWMKNDYTISCRDCNAIWHTMQVRFFPIGS